MNIESKELQDYVKSSLDAIKNGIVGTDFEIIEPVKFNLAITNIIEGEGKLKIYVVNAGGKLRSEEISHIEFEAQPLRRIKNQFRKINHSKNSSK